MARIISFVNQKGGTGKTTICINLAVGLAHKEKNVLVIDLDFQSNATTGLGIDRESINKNSFSLILNETQNPENFIFDTYLQNLKVIPASFDLEIIDTVHKVNIEKSINLKRSIDTLRDKFDFILIDNPPSISTITYSTIFATDYIYVPVEMSYFGLEGLDQIDEALSAINYLITEQRNIIEREVGTGEILFPLKTTEIGGVIINRWDSRTRISKEIFEILKNRYGDLLFETKIRQNTTIKEAIAEGKGIIDYAPSSRGAEDFRKLTEEVLTRESKREI